MSANHSQRAYFHIRNKLLEGSASPGSQPSDGPIGKEIGVSATRVCEAVVAAIRTGDPPAARDAMRRQIRNSLELTLRDAYSASFDRRWAK